MIKYKPKHQVKIGGEMNVEDAGVVGKRLANAALIFAILMGSAAVLAAIAQFFK